MRESWKVCYHQFLSFSKLTIIVNLGRLALARDYGKLIKKFCQEKCLSHAWSLLGRARALGMSVCVGWPLLFSAVAIW